MRPSNIIKFLIFFAIGGIVVWISIRGIGPEEWANMKEAAKEANYAWLALSMLFGFLSHFSRAIRWKMMLDTLGQPVRLMNSFMSLMCGYIVNLAFPRLGEATRIGLISRYEKIPIDKAVGTLISDRAIDVLTLLTITFFVTITQREIIGTFAMTKIWMPIQEKLTTLLSGNILLIVLLLAVVGIIGFFLIRSFGKIQEKIGNVVKSVWEGVMSVKKVKNPAMFIFHSFFIWAMYLMMTYICFLAFDFTSHLSLIAAMAVLSFATFGFLATPGGVGTYPVMVALIIGLYGIQYDLGLLFGWIIWAVQTFLVIIVGGLSFLFLPIYNRNEPQAVSAE